MPYLDESPLFDPLDLSGQRAAERTLAAAQTNAELFRQFADVSQENLQPFLDLASRTLPALEAGATPQGFFAELRGLTPLAEQIADPIIEEQTEELDAFLASRGLSRSGAAIQKATDIQEAADLSALLQLQNLLTGRRQQVVGQGAGTGTQLAGLGAQAGEMLGDIQRQGILSSQQALAQGQQNLLGLGGAISGFFQPRNQQQPGQ